MPRRTVSVSIHLPPGMRPKGGFSMKKLGRLSILAALILLIAIAAPRNSVHADPTEVSTWAELQAAFSSGGLGGEVEVRLAADIKAGPTDKALEIPVTVKVTLDLNGHILDRGLTEAAENGNVITVNVSSVLTIKDSDPSASHDPAIMFTDPVKGDSFTVTGGVITGGMNTGAGGAVLNNGALVVDGGAIVNNTGGEGGAVNNAEKATLIVNGGTMGGNHVTAGDGGAIFNAGTATINDGNFCGNLVTGDDPDGGAIRNIGTLEIKGGFIYRNKAKWGGGIHSTSNLTISGATITENKADDTGGGVLTYGCDNVQIKSGEISKNEAKQGGGIYISSGKITMTGGTITGNKALETAGYSGGGGVRITKTNTVFIMSGGTISDNEAAADGGGVCTTGQFYMTGADAVISGNKATYGGGVYAEYENAVFEMSGGTISGNEAKFLAGGVYVQKHSRFSMSGGKIINNTVLKRDNGHDGQGGGIFVYDEGSLNISGGTISGNKAPAQGGGVYSWVDINLSGSTTITENTVNDDADDVFLRYSQNIKVNGKLSGTVGVKADDLSYVITSGLSGNGNASNFQSNVPGYTIALNGSKEAIFQIAYYKVEIDTSMSNGTVETNKETATLDETVTLTVKPATGYELDKLTVKKGNDEVSVSGSDNSYTFKMPAGDVKVSATFKLKSFTVTWVIEGKEESEPYDYGTTPSYKKGTPVKETDEQYTYTFKEWTPAIVPVTQDATYTAVFDSALNKYKITFVNDDGSELQSSDVEYGKTPKYEGEGPTMEATAQYSYSFAGWKDAAGTAYTGDLPVVTGKATYTATYTATVNKYKITFVNDDGDELQSDEVEYGETPAYTGETPTKEEEEYYSYSFGKWSPDIEPVTGDATYTATYTATEKPAYTVADGGDAEVKQGAETDLVITVKRLPDDTTCFSHFTGVQIDGSDLAAEDYEAKEGSTVVTLKAAALQKLSVGAHTVKVSFDDGKAETSLTVKETPTEHEIPDTGDSSRLGLWISLMALTVLGSGLTACRRKCSGENE